MPVSARFARLTTYYTLSADKFGDIAAEYDKLMHTFNTVYSESLASKERSECSLDYYTGHTSTIFKSGFALSQEE